MLSAFLSDSLKLEVATVAWLGMSLSALAASECKITTLAPDLGSTKNLDLLHQRAAGGESPHFHHVHGQAVLGKETVYLSHLAVHMVAPAKHPHNFQVVQRISFQDPDEAAVYQEHRSDHPDALYTAVPTGFDQDDLQIGATLADTQIFLGHFEQGGQPIAPMAFSLNVDEILYFHEIIPDGKRLSTPHYIVFGVGVEIFAEHVVSTTPDFQQIVRVELRPPSASVQPEVADALANGLFVELPDRENTPPARLAPGESLSCNLTAAGQHEATSVTISVVSEEYCEEGELSAPVTDGFNTPKRCSP